MSENSKSSFVLTMSIIFASTTALGALHILHQSGALSNDTVIDAFEGVQGLFVEPEPEPKGGPSFFL